MAVHIVIVDDHKILREGIRKLLELDRSVKVVGEASNGLECMEIIKTMPFDVLVLDITMPNMDGFEVLQKIREKRIRKKVLVFTRHDEIEYVKKAVSIGISGYLLKSAGLSELKKAILTIYHGETYIQPSLKSELKEKMKFQNYSLIEDLTKREVEVLKLLAEGLYNKEIAVKLEISEKTVKNHVSNILKKMNVSDRTKAAIWAVRHGIMDK